MPTATLSCPDPGVTRTHGGSAKGPSWPHAWQELGQLPEPCTVSGSGPEAGSDPGAAKGPRHSLCGWLSVGAGSSLPCPAATVLPPHHVQRLRLHTGPRSACPRLPMEEPPSSIASRAASQLCEHRLLGSLAPPAALHLQQHHILVSIVSLLGGHHQHCITSSLASLAALHPH